MRTAQENSYSENLSHHVAKLITGRTKTGQEIAEDFPLYAPRQNLSRFLVRHELFKKVIFLKGSIIEGGVFRGAGLMSWAQLSAIYEPTNYQRQIIGFDTFAGFPNIKPVDTGGRIKNPLAKRGGLANNSYRELETVIKLYDANRGLSHMPKVNLIRGNFMKTGKTYIKQNPHLIISLLYLDFDIYEPTREALRLFLPRMSKGSVVAFDEVNNPDWPGETEALLESLNLNHYPLQQFPYEPNISFLTL
ncbi:MAG: TylF/MycF/NovP-related O-methyltransferase [Patescibacteria group bacterium]